MGAIAGVACGVFAILPYIFSKVVQCIITDKCVFVNCFDPLSESDIIPVATILRYYTSGDGVANVNRWINPVFYYSPFLRFLERIMAGWPQFRYVVYYCVYIVTKEKEFKLKRIREQEFYEISSIFDRLVGDEFADETQIHWTKSEEESEKEGLSIGIILPIVLVLGVLAWIIYRVL